MFADVAHLTQLTSCVGANSCGVGAPTLFGATSITATNVGEGYLADADNGNGATFAMTGSNQGMFNSYAAISAFWSDTTAMDNLRAADITATSVAGKDTYQSCVPKHLIIIQRAGLDYQALR